jgi:hypothetical protein
MGAGRHLTQPRHLGTGVVRGGGRLVYPYTSGPPRAPAGPLRSRLPAGAHCRPPDRLCVAGPYLQDRRFGNRRAQLGLLRVSRSAVGLTGVLVSDRDMRFTGTSACQ